MAFFTSCDSFILLQVGEKVEFNQASTVTCNLLLPQKYWPQLFTAWTALSRGYVAIQQTKFNATSTFLIHSIRTDNWGRSRLTSRQRHVAQYCTDNFFPAAPTQFYNTVMQWILVT